ncbi:CrcB family protein [Mesorhizobium sp. M0622]|uniref:fluoride efflux transporter FluC n=1 Tax=unclassified Mesorhizobium TaxID=325217 RepID=UPI0033381083
MWGFSSCSLALVSAAFCATASGFYHCGCSVQTFLWNACDQHRRIGLDGPRRRTVRIVRYWRQDARLFLTTGIIGGFTTFSTSSLDAVTLWERDQPLAAIGYTLASVVSLAALLLTFLLVRRWL